LTDESTGATFSISQAVSNAERSSAEWITEAPSTHKHTLALGDFENAYFGHDYANVAFTCYATVNGVEGQLSSFGSAVYEVTMITNSLTVKAQPSLLSTDGTSFAVTWRHS